MAGISPDNPTDASVATKSAGIGRQTEGPRPRELVGVFADFGSMEQAVDELQRSGFARYSMSVGGPPSAQAEDEIAIVLADDPKAAKLNYFGTEALGNAEGALVGAFAYVPALSVAGVGASAGMGALSIVGLMIASGGTGALIGLALAAAVAHRWHDVHRRQIENGGLLLWVTIPSAEREQVATDIMKRHAAHHVHSRDLP